MWFKKKIFKKVICHEDWVPHEKTGEPVVTITKKEHKHRNPTVFLSKPLCYSQVMQNNDVVIYRGLDIYKGTTFSVDVEIS